MTDIFLRIVELSWQAGVLALASARIDPAEAIAHANGSHEHNGPPIEDPDGRYRTSDGTRMSFPRLGSLYPWPDPA